MSEPPHSPPAEATPSAARPPRTRYLAVEIVAIVFSVLFALMIDEWRENANEQRVVGRVLETLRSEIVQNQQSVRQAFARHDSIVNALEQGGFVMFEIDLADAGITARDPGGLARALQRVMTARGSPPPADLTATRLPDGRYQFTLAGEGSAVGTIEGTRLTLRRQGGIALRPAVLRDNAWNVAQATGALVSMDFDIVARFAELHQMHTLHDETVDKIVDLMYSAVARSPEVPQAGGEFLWALYDLRSYEQMLLASYDTLLEHVQRNEQSRDRG